MKIIRTLLFLALWSIGAGPLFAQGSLDPAKVGQAPTDGWTNYHGDYSGRRYSTLKQINANNINSLSLAWVFRANVNQGAIKATPLVVNGVMYFTVPDHVWAIDARTGREIWHHVWPSQGGIHIGNRGVGILGDTLYVETADCNLVALNLKDGKEKWRKTICDLDQFFFGSTSPIIVKNHVITGISGDDLDRAGYIQSHDPVTGKIQWRWYVVPQKMGDPGSETWPNEDAMKHGGGMTWQPITYDPELNLIYVPTGNPQPVIAHKNRAGANLYTESIVALNPDTGKMVWYFQASPHDTHDWDATQVPVLFDGEVNGQKRKLLAQASRNGFFFVLDRATGKNILTTEFVKTNWSKGIDAKGQPIPNPAKEPQVDGALVTPNQYGATNWPPPSFSPDTGLFYVNAFRAFSIYYIYDPDLENPQGWGGTDRGGWQEAMMQAIDYKTGKIRWSHKWEGGGSRSGVLTTAGNLVFTGDGTNNFVALDARTGDALWHANLGAGVANGPITYELNGNQYVVVGAGDTLYGFVMLAKEPSRQLSQRSR
ncbi:MAG TPA: acido-empty-quinoprotein group A [Blastocatellia bacterium]|nr:acido-empty-quinoprotein group A [Blastocatellia bacterium]